MPELFQLDQQVVADLWIGGDADHGAAFMHQIDPLVQDQGLIDLGSGNKEKLFVGVGDQLLE